jgi:signal transduction histidine kinase
MNTGLVLALVAAVTLAVAVAAVAVGRWSAAMPAFAVGVLMILMVPAAGPFPTPAQAWVGMAAAVLLAPGCALLIAPRSLATLAVAVGALLAGPVRVAVSDPFRDPECTERCLPNPFAVAAIPDLTGPLLVTGVAVIVAGAVVLAWQHRSDPLRAGAAVVIAVAAFASPRYAPALLGFAAAAAVSVLTVDLARALVARRRIDELVWALRADPTDLTAQLRDQLGDPTLALYHRVDGRRFADRSGCPEPSVGPGQVVTELRTADRVVTRVHHDSGGTEVASLAQALDPAARLAIDNDRLAATVAVRADELRRARLRIVQHADAQRMALERDVHDSAQQHLLALGLELRVAEAALVPGTPVTRVVADCQRETQAALDSLRDLSHGIYPAQLAAAGLAHALRSLARRSTVPLDVTRVPQGRLPTDVERTAYAVVTHAAACARGALRVTIEAEPSTVGLRIEGVGAAPPDLVADRVAALGGTLRGNPGSWEVQLPCVSS